MHRRLTRRGVLLMALCAFAAWGQSDKPADKPEADPDALRPKYVIEVVTDTKIPQAQKNVTQKVMVLDSADFEQMTTANRALLPSGPQGPPELFLRQQRSTRCRGSFAILDSTSSADWISDSDAVQASEGRSILPGSDGSLGCAALRTRNAEPASVSSARW